MSSWVGTARSTWALPLLVLSVVGAVVAVVVGATWLVSLCAVFVVTFSQFIAVEVRVDAAGLRVRPKGVPGFQVAFPLDRIRDARAIEVVPIKWGGWGYRGSVRLFGRGAWVLRRGDGIAIDLVDGKSFAVTVDDAADGAAVLRRLLDSRPG